MANIKITVDGPLMDGHKITFKAPCNCDVVEKLNVLYVEDGTQKNRLFTMKDSHGNDLTGLGNLFFEGAYVNVVLDAVNGFAYLQNADTNSYLEGKFGGLKFAQDAEGNWGYIPSGADTVIPFKRKETVYSIGAGVNNNTQVNTLTLDVTNYSRVRICHLYFMNNTANESRNFCLTGDGVEIVKICTPIEINNPTDGSYEYDISNVNTLDVTIKTIHTSKSYCMAAIALS